MSSGFLAATFSSRGLSIPVRARSVAAAGQFAGVVKADTPYTTYGAV